MKDIRKREPKFGLNSVFREIPQTFLYYVIGSMVGFVFALALFKLNKDVLETLLDMWRRRLLFGAELIGGSSYSFWFIVNNLVVMFVVILASVFILMQISRKPRGLGFMKRFERFKNVEREQPKITLLGLYMVPIGALLINGFLISMFATYVLLSYGFEKFVNAVLLLLPHGINEIAALVLACSLGLSYLGAMKPLILKGRSKAAIELGKKLLRTDTTFYIIVMILLLVIFSGFLEGMLGVFIIK